jgi:hypothetical protein
MDGARELGDKFSGATNRDRSLPDYFIQLSPLYQVHAEVAVTTLLADFMNRNDERMVETGGRFGLETEALQVCLGCPATNAKDFECNSSVKTFLSRPIDYTLAAAANLL